VLVNCGVCGGGAGGLPEGLLHAIGLCMNCCVSLLFGLCSRLDLA